jgi:hypothetical protein
MTDTNQVPNQAPKDLIGFLDFYLVQKAPFQIPDGGREWIVKFGPWITVVLLVLMLPPLLFVLGVGATLVPFAGTGYATGFTYHVVVLIVQLALTVMALPGLFARKMTGWKLLFYAQIVSVAGALLNYAFVGAIIGGLISFYVLFQVRAKYVN